MSLVTKILNTPKVKSWIEDEANAWIVEGVTRFLSKNPYWYYWINWILIGLSGMSTVLFYMSQYGIVLPTIIIHGHTIVLSVLATKAAILIPAAIRFGTQFAVKEKTIDVTTDGSVIQDATAATRPYTAIVEQKTIAKIEANKVVDLGKATANATP